MNKSLLNDVFQSVLSVELNDYVISGESEFVYFAPFVANICNMYAKTTEEREYWYGLKEVFTDYIAKYHDGAWYKDNILYCETEIAQVSFHVFNDEYLYAREGEEREEWSGIEVQSKAIDLFKEAWRQYNEVILEGGSLSIDEMEARELYIEDWF